MAERLRVGVVGVGTIGRIHAEAVRRVGADVVAVVGRDSRRAAAVAAELEVPQAYDRLEAILERRDVDVVHICTPNNLHFAMARDALEAGKHVVCEKPLTLTAEESRRLLGVAERSGRIHAVGFNNRFYPLVQEMRHRVGAGGVGRVFSLRGQILEDSLLLDTDYEWRLDPLRGGPSNAVATIGCHLTDLVTHILGSSIVEVCAAFTTVHPVRRRAGRSDGEAVTEEVAISSEDEARLLVRFAGGAEGTLDLSRVAAGRRYRISVEIDGTTLALAWNSEAPNQLWIGHRGRPNEILMRDPDLLAGPARPYAGYIGAYAEAFPDTMKQMLRSVYARIRAPGDPGADLGAFATFADGHRAMLVHEAVLRSAKERRWSAVAG